MLNCSILKIFGQFRGKSKNLENHYRILTNRTFKPKNLQFTELTFRNQEFAKKIDQNLKKLDREIGPLYGHHCVRYKLTISGSKKLSAYYLRISFSYRTVHFFFVP